MTDVPPEFPDESSMPAPSEVTGAEKRQFTWSRRKALQGFTLSGLAMGGGIAAMNREKMTSLVQSTRSLRFELEDWLKAETAPRMLPNHDAYAAFLNRLNLRYITAEEVIRPHRNVRNGVANHLPPKHMWKRLIPTLKIADQIRHELGSKLVCINSAYRSPEYNAVCPGAASRSYHMKNCALDLIFEARSEKAAEAAKKLRDAGAFRGGIGTYSGFIHIDTRGHNATWTV